MRVNLRWSRCGSGAFPFQYDVEESTTVREVCRMVIETNNRWHGNPRFSVVKVISTGPSSNDKASRAVRTDGVDGTDKAVSDKAVSDKTDITEQGREGREGRGGRDGSKDKGDSGRVVLVDDDLRVGDLRGEDGECYFVFVAG